MKKYSLIVMYPGMSSIRPTIYAHNFDAKDGGYYFYQNKSGEFEVGEDTRILICVYPICSTIIDSIEEEK